MPYAVIPMTENFLFYIPSGQTITQPQRNAVNVAPYQFVTPYVHIRASVETNIPNANQITFNFLSAPLLPTPDQVTPPSYDGDFFTDTGAPIVINQAIIGLGLPGKIFPLGNPSAGYGFLAINNPGGLLIWQVSNADPVGSPYVFRADVYLVCRGP